MAVVNSYILFKQHQLMFPDNEALRRPPKYSLVSYREELIRNILDIPETDLPPVLKQSVRESTNLFGREKTVCGVYEGGKGSQVCLLLLQCSSM